MRRRAGVYASLFALRAELDRVLERFRAEPPAAESGWTPAADLVECPDSFRVDVELPGIAASQVEVALCDQTLTIRGTKARSAGEPEATRFQLVERFTGPFEAVIVLPRPVMPSRVTARLANGVLTVRLPVLVERRHRHHVIAVSEEPSDERST